MGKQRLIDAERLKRHYSWWTGSMELTREDLDTIVDMQPDAAPAWIPVSERLPEVGTQVLCRCRANIYEVMTMEASGIWIHDTEHAYMHSFVTHWMPLPEPYKEGE